MIPKKDIDRLKPDMQAIADITAQTGVSYFKQAFRDKQFDGEPWQEAKVDEAETRRRGSLMIDSAALMNTVRIAESTPTMVKWAAGSDRVPYAQVHNEGGKAGRGAGFIMPKRQFMGEAEELNDKTDKRIRTFLDKQFL